MVTGCTLSISRVSGMTPIFADAALQGYPSSVRGAAHPSRVKESPVPGEGDARDWCAADEDTSPQAAGR
jgi:hypothetical protein